MDEAEAAAMAQRSTVAAVTTTTNGFRGKKETVCKEETFKNTYRRFHPCDDCTTGDGDDGAAAII